jgi:hypothetical protein
MPTWWTYHIKSKEWILLLVDKGYRGLFHNTLAS